MVPGAGIEVAKGRERAAVAAVTRASRFASAVSDVGAGPVNTISAGVLPEENGVAPTVMSADACNVRRCRALSPANAFAQMFVTVVALSLPPSEIPSTCANLSSATLLSARMEGSSRLPDAGAFALPP